jgi:tetratricopeptide (TPR) repeat protein
MRAMQGSYPEWRLGASAMPIGEPRQATRARGDPLGVIRNPATEKPLQLSVDADEDLLLAVEFGSVIDGKPDDETIACGEAFGFFLDTPNGRLIGFWLDGLSDCDPNGLAGPVWSEPRFDAPVLGLRQSLAGEIILSAQAYIGGASTADNLLFHAAVAQQDPERAEALWRLCLGAGNLKAHFALGYTLCEQGRYHEAYGHLRLYTELCPKNSWAWCWFGQTCVGKGDVEEARDAYWMAIDLERIGSFETNAGELLAEVWESEGDPAEVDGACGS